MKKSLSKIFVPPFYIEFSRFSIRFVEDAVSVLLDAHRMYAIFHGFIASASLNTFIFVMKSCKLKKEAFSNNLAS